MNIKQIQQMAKQAQQMQEQMQRQMAETRIEATAGGGMVTVGRQRLKQVLSLKIDPRLSRKTMSRCCRISSLRPSPTPTARRRSDAAADGRPYGRHETARDVLRADVSNMAQPESLTRLIDQLQRLPGIGRKSAQRAGLPHHEGPA